MKDHFRINGVPGELHEEIKNLADNSFKTVNDFMKPILRQIVERYPVELRQKKVKQDSSSIYIRGLSREIEQELENIIENLGADRASFLKIHLQNIIQAYPTNMKRPRGD